MMKIRKGNDVTDCTDVVFIENEKEFSWSIGPGSVCNENQTR